MKSIQRDPAAGFQYLQNPRKFSLFLMELIRFYERCWLFGFFSLSPFFELKFKFLLLLKEKLVLVTASSKDWKWVPGTQERKVQHLFRNVGGPGQLL